MKYIIFDEIFPVIFNEAIAHRDMLVSSMKPTSAGFVSIMSIEGSIYAKASGESISLNLSSKKKDSELITRTLLMY
jgi:hypothetical protein